jgi:branched-subunit amino acid ABC-type transport system permease component
MKTIARLAVAGVFILGAGTAAYADCNNDTGTETVLGAGAGAAVGGLASGSIAGAVIGGVGGGLIGNSIGQSNNRADCRAEAREYYREREEATNDRYVEPTRDGYARDRDRDYPDDN